MSAVNSAVVLIFAITLTMINFSSSQFPHNSGVLQCQSVGQDCSSKNDCVGNCTCEELSDSDGTYRHQCAEPFTPVPSPHTVGY
uniref:Defensin n=1 Tax=Rhipicephalus appendiculatus TaxID=34631 RepID=A0A131YT98_RHIAP